VFHLSQSSYALVNLKPLLPGHVLVSPIRVVPRFNELTAAEVTDLFLTVQRVSRMIERVFKATALNIAIQDGSDAGQSVPHVHAHIIPRSSGDLNDRGGNDAIYGMMDGEEGNLGSQLRDRDTAKTRSKFPAPDAEESRKPRSEEEMTKEAEWLAQEMENE
jgi:bis(5'-adenosyl)-triphosphatase